ncbi:MAG: chemotaxis protein CheB [Bacteroidota bacterium]
MILKPFTIVGIGASAGGLKALEELFQHLSDNTGQAFVIVQHLSRKHISLMDQILGRDTRMPVLTAEDRMEVQPNHVYLIPAGKLLTIDNYRLQVDAQHPSRLPSFVIDHFFHSLGQSLKDQSIGVILSGTGTDGSKGIQTIKEQGGITLVQDPRSGQFEGMPNSAIQTQMVDFVLNPENIARKLSALPLVQRETDLPQNDKLSGGLSKLDPIDGHMRHLLELLFKSKGVNFFNYKTGTLQRRIEKNMLAHDIANLEEYVIFLRNNPQQLDRLFHEILINVTGFFRDPEAFGKIEKDILPRLFSPGENQEEVRIWHCGCSTGEEVYSLLMLIFDHCEAHQLSPKLKILATDLDDQALEIARMGRYTPAMMEGVSKNHVEKYFEYDEFVYTIKKDLRNQVIFSVSDATKDPPFIHMDLIVCRNMLIYLKPPIQEKLFLNFHFSLKAGRFLWLGSSENILNMPSNFSSLSSNWKIFQHHGHTPPFKKSYHQPSILQEQSSFSSKETVFPLIDRRTHRSRMGLMNTLLDRYVNSCVVMDAEFEIVFVVGSAGHYLQLSKGMASMNLLSMIPQHLIVVVRDAIKRLNKGEGAVLYPGVFPGEEEQEGFDLLFDILPISKTTKEVYFLMEWREIGRDMEASPEVRVLAAPDPQETMDLIFELQEELQISHHEVQTIMEELETSNEELQASNEELQASNEELQSTNEELQSVNEELHTVNHELEERNKELIILYRQVDYLLNSIGIISLLLDLELRIQFFTPSIVHYVPLKQTDIHRKITDFHFLDEYEGLQEEIHSVIQSGQATGNHFHGKNEKISYRIEVKPFLEVSQKMSGIVISFTSEDIAPVPSIE